MAAIFTPTLILAAGGFMKGDGLGVSGSFTSAVNKFQTTGITGNFSSAITAATNNNDTVLLQSLQSAVATYPFLSGNVVTQAVAAANAPFAKGVGGFISNFGQANAFGVASYEFAGALAQASSMSFSDFGGKTKGYSDLLSGGVSAQFPNLKGMAASLEAISNLGGVEQLSALATPGGLVKNVLDSGAGSLGGLAEKLEEAGLTPADLDDPAAQETIRRILSSISGNDMKQIMSAIGLPATASITNLADAMNPDKIMPAIPGVSLPTAASLANSIQDIGGSFKDLFAMSGFLKSISVPSFPRLDGLKSPIPDDIKLLMAPFMGAGAGPFGNPTLQDMLGSAAGHTHTAAINTIIGVQSQIANSALGSALNQAIASSDPSAISSAMNSIATSGNSDLQATIAKGNSSIAKMSTQLATESRNLGISGFSAATGAPPVTALMSFAGSLHTLGVDKMGLGTGKMLEELASDSVFGDVIKASMIEGRNQVALSGAGAKNTSFMDANSQKLDPYKYTKDADLTYSGANNVVYDRISAERAGRGLPPLSYPRPPD